MGPLGAIDGIAAYSDTLVPILRNRRFCRLRFFDHAIEPLHDPLRILLAAGDERQLADHRVMPARRVAVQAVADRSDLPEGPEVAQLFVVEHLFAVIDGLVEEH